MNTKAMQYLAGNKLVFFFLLVVSISFVVFQLPISLLNMNMRLWAIKSLHSQTRMNMHIKVYFGTHIVDCSSLSTIDQSN